MPPFFAGAQLAIVLRCAIREQTKKSVREFTGSDDYKVGDLSKEIDQRVKASVAELRGKEEYELGDLTLALDKIAKDEVMKMTGKDTYEVMAPAEQGRPALELADAFARSCGGGVRVARCLHDFNPREAPSVRCSRSLVTFLLKWTRASRRPWPTFAARRRTWRGI